MPIYIHSSTSLDRTNSDGTINPKKTRRFPGALGPIDLTPITELDISSLDGFTFQVFDLKTNQEVTVSDKLYACPEKSWKFWKRDQ